MSVDSKRAIFFVHEGCGNGSMIVFTPDGRVMSFMHTSSLECVGTVPNTIPEALRK